MVCQSRGPRLGNFGPQATGGQTESRPLQQTSMAKGFGNGKSAWKNNIWGGGTLGSGLYEDNKENDRLRGGLTPLDNRTPG